MLGRYSARQPEKFLQSDGILLNSVDFEAKMSPPTFGNRSTEVAIAQGACLTHSRLASCHRWAVVVSQGRTMIALVGKSGRF